MDPKIIVFNGSLSKKMNVLNVKCNVKNIKCICKNIKTLKIGSIRTEKVLKNQTY